MHNIQFKRFPPTAVAQEAVYASKFINGGGMAAITLSKHDGFLMAVVRLTDCGILKSTSDLRVPSAWFTFDQFQRKVATLLETAVDFDLIELSEIGFR